MLHNQGFEERVRIKLKDKPRFTINAIFNYPISTTHSDLLLQSLKSKRFCDKVFLKGYQKSFLSFQVTFPKRNNSILTVVPNLREFSA